MSDVTGRLPPMDPKAALRHYLDEQRTSLVGKLDGLDEYAVRRPLTPTGTNLLGLVKHVAWIQLGYFTTVFGRPPGRVAPYEREGGNPDDDMWAQADEPREAILELHRYSAQQADAALAELPLDTPGVVPWWRPGHQGVTLHRIAVHVIVDTSRHAGQADILRETLDGRVGMKPDDPNIPGRTPQEWAEYRGRIEAAARTAAGLPPA